MRLIMEPTEDQTKQEFPQHRVVIEVVGDDQDINAVGSLLRAMLLAYGYQSKSVDELIEPQ